MFTLFHLLLIIGLIIGIYVGSVYFSSLGLGTFGGAIIGAIGGFILFWVLPLKLSFLFLRNDLSKDDAAKLKERLKREYYISHLIIAELVQRGESIEQFRDFVLSQLQAEYSDERQFGWQNLNIWFPELAKQIEPFDPETPTDEDKTRLASLQRAT